LRKLKIRRLVGAKSRAVLAFKIGALIRQSVRTEQTKEREKTRTYHAEELQILKQAFRENPKASRHRPGTFQELDLPLGPHQPHCVAQRGGRVVKLGGTVSARDDAAGVRVEIHPAEHRREPE